MKTIDNGTIEKIISTYHKNILNELCNDWSKLTKDGIRDRCKSIDWIAIRTGYHLDEFNLSNHDKEYLEYIKEGGREIESYIVRTIREININQLRPGRKRKNNL